MQSIARTPANAPNRRKVVQYEFPSSGGTSIKKAAAGADAEPLLVDDKSTVGSGGNSKLRGAGAGPPPPSPSEWTVHEHAPQSDGGIVPTVAVSLWLGWMAFLIYSIAVLSVLGSSRAWAAFLGLCTLSLVVPRDFPAGPGKKFATWIFYHAQRYFGLTTVVEDAAALENLGKLDDDGDGDGDGRAAIFAFEPHDVLPYPVFAFHGSVSRGVIPGTVLSNVQALTTSAIFKIPFLRQVYSWTGCAPVDRQTFRAKLRRKESIVFCPGGVQEVTLMDPNQPDDLVLYLRSRKGFIRLALETGSPIVPTFGFHTDGSYGYWFPRGKLVSGVARTIGFLPLLFWGRFGIPFGIPISGRNVRVVIGRPIYVPREGEGNVSEESVERYHAMFLEEMEALFERHKRGAGYGHRTLKIL